MSYFLYLSDNNLLLMASPMYLLESTTCIYVHVVFRLLVTTVDLFVMLFLLWVQLVCYLSTQSSIDIRAVCSSFLSAWRLMDRNSGLSHTYKFIFGEVDVSVVVYIGQKQ